MPRHIVFLSLVILAMLGIGMSLLHLRHQRMQILHQTADLHSELQKSQRTLWQQQLDIAAYTSPETLNILVGQSESTTSEQAAPDASARE
jgi:cell division protein FtsL